VTEQSTKQFNVGMVGCGGMGKSHLRIIRDHLPEFTIAALCDVSEASVKEAGTEFDVDATYVDVEKMYDSEDIDLIVVATQTRGHRGPAVAALERGICVLCEKPIAIDMIEADEMVEAGAKTGALLAINQQNHVSPPIRKAQELVRQGLIGEVVLVRGRNKSGRKSGNEFMEMGTHVTDMMLCFGESPQWCAGTVYDDGQLAEVDGIMEATEMSPKDRDSGLVMGNRAIGHYGFEGGVLGEVQFMGYEENCGTNYGVDVLGTTGQLGVRTTGAGSLWHLPRPMEGKPGDFGDWQQVELPADEDVTAAMTTMYRELMRARDQGTELSPSGDNGRTALEMILGLYQSHREGGRRVALPLADRRHPLERWRSEDRAAGS
jgi:predicted dehydrogenase